MSPFDLNDHDEYARWRDSRLASCPQRLDELVVEVTHPASPSPTEQAAIREALARANMAIFVTPFPEQVDKRTLKAFGAHFGLRRLNHNEGADDDGVTTLSVAQGQQWRRSYIPYTNRAIHWHTDGYYNQPEAQIRGLMLYCDMPAVAGGENALLDPELAYIHLREQDPAFIAALSEPDVMTIPANDANDHLQRPDRSGPVFSLDDAGHLHMRYTARKRNIIWKDTPQVRAALAALTALLASDSPWIFRATLARGQGLICNNVLHDRSAFVDTDKQRRLLYRLRYFDRVC